jgi:hypothetical protein
MTRKLTLLACLAFGLFAFVVAVQPQKERFLRATNDFAGFYAGAAQSGTPQLYSYDANQRLVTRLTHATIECMTFTRPPFYAAILHPLAMLPYETAYWVYLTALLSALAWFVWRFSKECPELAVYALIAPACAATLITAEDTSFSLAIAASSILLFRRGRQFVGGMVLALCGIKFHLFLLIPLLLLLKRRWRALGGMACGGGLLLVFGALFSGWHSYVEWIDAIRRPVLSPRGLMINLYALVASFDGGIVVEIGLMAAVAALFVWMCLRSDDFELLFGVALIAGLLINVHTYVYDSVLLLLAFVLIRKPAARIVLALLLTPLAYCFIWMWSTSLYIVGMLLVIVLAAASLMRWPLPRTRVLADSGTMCK